MALYLIILFLVCDCWVMSNAEREKRRNEEECAARRCCIVKHNVNPSDLPSNLNCKLLSDEECGEYDEYCDWDCDYNQRKNDVERQKHKNKFRRKYVGISLQKGKYKEPELPELSNQAQHEYQTRNESLLQCLSDRTFVSIDDCGVVYEEEFDLNEQELFCKNHVGAAKQKKAIKKDYMTQKRRLTILGADGRSQVTSTDYPNSAVTLLLYVAGGKTGRCTATFIAPNWAITAAHCVYGYGDGDYYSSFRLCINPTACGSCSEVVDAPYALVGASYKTNPTVANDIALLRIPLIYTPHNIGGYFGFQYNAEYETSGYPSDNNFWIMGYPSDKPDCTKWNQYCGFNIWHADWMGSQACDIMSGDSGAGVYKWKYVEETGRWNRLINSIVSRGNSNYNAATRITAGGYKYLCEAIETDHPGHCLDDAAPEYVEGTSAYSLFEEEEEIVNKSNNLNNSILILFAISSICCIFNILWCYSLNKRNNKNKAYGKIQYDDNNTEPEI